MSKVQRPATKRRRSRREPTLNPTLTTTCSDLDLRVAATPLRRAAFRCSRPPPGPPPPPPPPSPPPARPPTPLHSTPPHSTPCTPLHSTVQSPHSTPLQTTVEALHSTVQSLHATPLQATVQSLPNKPHHSPVNPRSKGATEEVGAGTLQTLAETRGKESERTPR